MASPPKPRRWSILRFSLRSLLILMTLICIGIVAKQQYDWYRQRQLIHEWIAPLVAKAEAANGDVAKYEEDDRAFSWVAPEGMKDNEQVAIFSYGILELDKSVERVATLKLLVESRGIASIPILRDLVRRTKDRELQALIIHLIAMDRNPDDLPQFELLLDNSEPEIRAAAADAIGWVKQPAYDEPNYIDDTAPGRSNSLPPISLSLLHGRIGALIADLSAGYQSQPPLSEDERQQKIPQRLRDRLEHMMLGGATRLEREAAARALVGWPPPKYSLRVAEWGVWADDRGRRLVTRRALEEIPPFVHQTGNSFASLPHRQIHGQLMILKPVVHLTADCPLAVDLEVKFMRGRPWYAYPRPDTLPAHVDAIWPHFIDESEEREGEDEQDPLKDLAPAHFSKAIPGFIPAIGASASSQAVPAMSFQMAALACIGRA